MAGADGHVIFDPAWFDFVDDIPAPDTVNPSLGRQAQLMRRGGLYKVTDGSDDGLVIIDCMSGVESAEQGMALFREHVGDKPVVAVVYTHTRIDHYGGIGAKTNR